jgi:putative flavoprotein involved in K+ transport
MWRRTNDSQEDTVTNDHTALRPHRPPSGDGPMPAIGTERERVDVVVVGGGQAGLAVGYYLARQRRRFVILDSHPRVGDVWRRRWDSLRLFTPARYDGLPGWSFPAPAWSFPSRDEMADYLEAYAARFELPVRTGMRVTGLRRVGERYLVTAGGTEFEAEHVVVASGQYHLPTVPAFAGRLDPSIRQLHSTEYRDPSQLRGGDVLVVGAGNSGADIAIELSRDRRTWLSGPDKGAVPFRIEGRAARLLLPLLWLFASHVLTVRTPIGRKVRPKAIAHGAPLIRVKPADIAAAGIERVPRTVEVHDGAPVLEDGRIVDVANVVWCTGLRPDFGWIDLPVFGEDGMPACARGVVGAEPGLYFVGLDFLHAFTSENVGGVGRDAKHIAKRIGSRTRAAVAHAG